MSKGEKRTASRDLIPVRHLWKGTGEPISTNFLADQRLFLENGVILAGNVVRVHIGGGENCIPNVRFPQLRP